MRVIADREPDADEIDLRLSDDLIPLALFEHPQARELGRPGTTGFKLLEKVIASGARPDRRGLPVRLYGEAAVDVAEPGQDERLADLDFHSTTVTLPTLARVSVGAL